MSDYMVETEKWLTLSQAAKQLNVHPTTLRRWAENGAIPYMLTPGKHRRFATADIRRFAAGRRVQRGPDLEQLWAEKALVHTRQEIAVKGDKPWLAVQDNALRERHRRLGRQLMGLTLQYISDPNSNGSLLEQARAIGLEYGDMAQQENLPLPGALQAVMFFRDMLVEVALQLPEAAHIKPEANVKLMRRINKLLNTVHLAVAEVYDKK